MEKSGCECWVNRNTVEINWIKYKFLEMKWKHLST